MHTWQTHASANTHSHTSPRIISLFKRAIRGDFAFLSEKGKQSQCPEAKDGMLMKPQKGLFLCACSPSTPFHISGSPQLCAAGVFAGAKTRHINWWHWKANEEQQWVMRESAGLVSLSQGNASNTMIGWNENNQMRSSYMAGAGKGGRTVRSVLYSVQSVAAPLWQTMTAGDTAIVWTHS